MADPYANALNSIAEGIQNVVPIMDRYHKEHVAYDQASQMADAFSRLGLDTTGQLTSTIGPDGKPKKDIVPILSPDAVNLFKTNVHDKQVKNTGAMEAIARIGLGTAAKAASQHIEDASLSGQRTRQIINQDTEMFPLDVEQKKAQTAHLKKITEDEGKVNVPGFGMMTPPQYSVHVARQKRLDDLARKTEPLKQFENQLQGAYGLGIKDIVDASQPKEFKDATGKTTYKGTPFYDINGTQVSAKDAAANPNQTFIHAGPNNVPIPYFDKKSGLGWQQIVGKAKTMAPQMDKMFKDQTDLQNQQTQIQAQQIIALHQGKDPATLSPQDQQALEWAKQQLGQ